MSGLGQGLGVSGLGQGLGVSGLGQGFKMQLDSGLIQG